MLNYFCHRVLNPDSQHETYNSSFTSRAYRLIMWLVTLQVYQEQFHIISQYYKPSYLAILFAFSWQLYWPDFIFYNPTHNLVRLKQALVFVYLSGLCHQSASFILLPHPKKSFAKNVGKQCWLTAQYNKQQWPSGSQNQTKHQHKWDVIVRVRSSLALAYWIQSERAMNW